MATNDPKPIPTLTQKDIERFWSKVDKTPGHGPQGECWLWTDKPNIRSGYGYFMIRRNNKHKLLSAHRVSFSLQFGNPPSDKPHVCHACDIPQCVNPAHLFAGTQLDNLRDCATKGRTRNGQAKLTEEQVYKIRKLHEIGRTGRSVAKKFHVSEPAVSAVVHRHSWKHLK